MTKPQAFQENIICKYLSAHPSGDNAIRDQEQNLRIVLNVRKLKRRVTTIYGLAPPSPTHRRDAINHLAITAEGDATRGPSNREVNCMNHVEEKGKERRKART